MKFSVLLLSLLLVSCNGPTPTGPTVPDGNIEVEAGEKVLYDYVNTGKTVYQPER